MKQQQEQKKKKKKKKDKKIYKVFTGAFISDYVIVNKTTSMTVYYITLMFIIYYSLSI